MAIVRKDEAILLRDGKVATETNCCCECPPGKQCGPKCCKSEETCCEGVDKQNCCDPSETCCDGTCCSQSQTCCADECCDTVCCDGVCCPPGQVCCGGVCCDPAKCCNGTCCPPDQSCRSGQCSPCNCPETQECCGSTDGDPDVCCDYGQCCGEACCAAGEVCCTQYNDNWDVVSQKCCRPEKCCVNGACCKDDEECVDGECRKTCAECIRFFVAPVPLDPTPCNPQTILTQSIAIPPSCPSPVWVRLNGSVDDDIAIDGNSIKGECAFAGGLTYGFLADGDFEISLIDNYGVFYSADIEICFFSEAPPP